MTTAYIFVGIFIEEHDLIEPLGVDIAAPRSASLCSSVAQVDLTENGWSIQRGARCLLMTQAV
jgi:hypothetical protein